MSGWQVLLRVALVSCGWVVPAHGQEAKLGLAPAPTAATIGPLIFSDTETGKPNIVIIYADDLGCGEVKALEDTGLADNTLVFFSSDNGCSSGPSRSKELARKFGHYTSAKLRGYKGGSFEGGTRVPFMVRWPGVVAAGLRCDQLVCQIDYLATIADVLDVPRPDEAGVDSVSFLPLLIDPAGPPTRESLILHSYVGQFSLRQGPSKLILAPGNGNGFGGGPSDAEAIRRGDPAVQLYDLKRDLAETNNLAPGHPERVEAMTELLSAGVTAGRTTKGGRQTNDEPIDLHKKVRAGK